MKYHAYHLNVITEQINTAQSLCLRGTNTNILRAYPLWSIKKQSYSSKQPGICHKDDQNTSEVFITVITTFDCIFIKKTLIYHIHCHPVERTECHIYTSHAHDPCLPVTDVVMKMSLSTCKIYQI